MKYEINLMGLQRFDEGTHVTILGKPKFVLLVDEIQNK
jgi:hypothetical protein